MSLKPFIKTFLRSQEFTAGRAILRSVFIPPLRGYFKYFPVLTGKRTAWKYLADHLWWLESRARANTFFGRTIDVDARDGCGRFIYYFGVWEPNLTAFIQSHLRHGDCFVDVGANVGYFSLLASTLVGQSGKVVSIEPVQSTFEVLTRNLDANRAQNVRAVNMAVWDKEETLTFYISSETIIGVSTVIAARAEKGLHDARCDVRAAPLCSLLSPDEIAAARLIKIDVEGAENRVIFGLGSLLESGRRDLEVVMEISIAAFDEIVFFFRKHGFFSYHMENEYSIVPYIGGNSIKKPARLEVAPDGATQVDVIFSRVDAASLP
ncbi:MAG TPA: FkbM family methyltransferase [Terriglobia bacterium]|nr:FkbM family methyltransferase [Terriglobia bacterium]